jgi:putative PIN family toxin of toxin-antitoxin system
MIILLDTNVLIAAFIANGVCARLLEYCFSHHQLVTSDFILTEYRQKLETKFRRSPEDIGEALSFLRSRMQIVMASTLEEGVCRDPDDDNVLAAAMAGECQVLITGDKDLLELKAYKNIFILSPKEFMEQSEL